MKTSNSIGSLQTFIETAPVAQLLQFENATPVLFKTNYLRKSADEPIASFVAVRGLKQHEADDWSRSITQRKLIDDALAARKAESTDTILASQVAAFSRGIDRIFRQCMAQQPNTSSR